MQGEFNRAAARAVLYLALPVMAASIADSAFATEIRTKLPYAVQR
jgi:hypothetical protein